MKVAIIDADLIGRKNHRFPNLACMKLSGYYKELGFEVSLRLDYENLKEYDLVLISKVFTDTPVPEGVLTLPNVRYGGTGFYYDKAPKLGEMVEHHMPDYHLYDDWVNSQIEKGCKASDFTYYKDYSIGFLTRGCFRKCSFCVNKNYSKVSLHSPLNEFLDVSRPKICLLDDNFFGCSSWKALLTELQKINKPFIFKQGLDERLLTDEKCELLFKSKYAGDFIFAFDNLADAKFIEEKLKLIRKYTNTVPKFYCFTGYDRNDKWDEQFWKQDILDLFKRIEILMKYRCLPYVMRFERYKDSKYKGMYTSIARWCNQPSFFKKKTFYEFCLANGENSACKRYADEYLKDAPEAAYFYNLHFN